MAEEQAAKEDPAAALLQLAPMLRRMRHQTHPLRLKGPRLRLKVLRRSSSSRKLKMAMAAPTVALGKLRWPT
jgi:hypothetical protein